MRLIDADALYQSFGASGNCSNCPLDAYKCQYYNEHTLMEFCERIDDAPTVDAEPVKHGHWSLNPHNGEWDVCSTCGIGTKRREYGIDPSGNEYVTEYSYQYCPHCGAKMRGFENEDYV